MIPDPFSFSRRIFLLALLGLTIESCQGALLSDTSERGFPKEITGKDGAPMVLVPTGEFLYGDDNQRMSLPAFYMDKYELTVSRYASFLQASGRMQPEYWNQASQVSAGDRPVIEVDWYDAHTYCRQYAKRLPTEQEWEKAARGTDGRKYPWGNDEPSDRYANFGKDWNNLNYESEQLTAVGSYEDGKSPFGIYDLAGNVWEWTSTADDNHLVKVVRGGSWRDGPSNLRSAKPNVVEPSIRTSFTGGFRCVQDGMKKRGRESLFDTGASNHGEK